MSHAPEPIIRLLLEVMRERHVVAEFVRHRSLRPLWPRFLTNPYIARMAGSDPKRTLGRWFARCDPGCREGVRAVPELLQSTLYTGAGEWVPRPNNPWVIVHPIRHPSPHSGP